MAFQLNIKGLKNVPLSDIATGELVWVITPRRGPLHPALVLADDEKSGERLVLYFHKDKLAVDQYSKSDASQLSATRLSNAASLIIEVPNEVESAEQRSNGCLVIQSARAYFLAESFDAYNHKIKSYVSFDDFKELMNLRFDNDVVLDTWRLVALGEKGEKHVVFSRGSWAEE